MSAAVQADAARLLLGGIARAGVTDVVVSPGSRSTPFVVAAQESGLRVHHVIDERSAAFFALGMGRATGRPALLVCTSGSAPAHYLPAIVEASCSHVPLIALSADRPHAMQGCGAPQTIEQVALYGSHVRVAIDLALPRPDDGSVAATLRAATRAVLGALSPDPGPVHVNARADKPLEPAEARGADERSFRAAVDRALERGPTRVWWSPPRAPSAAIEALTEAIGSASRGLLVCGPASPSSCAEHRASVLALARATGFPIAAETTSQLRLVERDALAGMVVADGLLPALASARVRDALVPDLVLQLGEPPIASGWEPWCLQSGAARWIVAPAGWPDPYGVATDRIVAEIGPTLDAVTRRLRSDSRDRSAPWARTVRAWSDAWWRAVDLSGTSPEAEVVRATVEALPRGAHLVVGNSLVVRHLDAYVRAGAAAVTVVSQRGASGIDGLLAGAAGVACSVNGPVVLLIGDVAWLHDVGSLELLRRTERTLVVVALNNDGGRIFEQLPVAAARPDGLEAWTTPHGLELATIARAFGIESHLVDEPTALCRTLHDAWSRGGVTVIEARVPAHGEAARRRALLDALERSAETMDFEWTPGARR